MSGASSPERTKDRSRRDEEDVGFPGFVNWRHRSASGESAGCHDTACSRFCELNLGCARFRELTCKPSGLEARRPDFEKISTLVAELFQVY